MTFTFLRDDGTFAPLGVSSTSTQGSGGLVIPTVYTSSLASSVNFSSAAYTDGPSVAQGSSGVWFVAADVAIGNGTAGTANILKLWDGTNSIAITNYVPVTGMAASQVSLSGVMINPAGNLRISGICSAGGAAGFQAVTATAGNTGPYSSITAIRVG